MMLQKAITKAEVIAKTHWYRAIYKINKTFSIKEGLVWHRNITKKVPEHFPEVLLGDSLENVERKIKADGELCEKIISQANMTMDNSFLILNRNRPDMFDEKMGHYRWKEDFLAGYTFSDCCFIDARKQCIGKEIDVKIPWETSRMQYLFSLALAYRVTHDEKYAQKIKHIIEDFCECNRYNVGVNWNVSMEVGIRLANIILACELIKDSAVMDCKFRQNLAMLVYEHRNHIKHNLENPRNGANHFLADLMGLAVACVAFPFLPGTKTYLKYTKNALHYELARQTLNDGGNFECSTSYHRLSGELLGVAFIALSKTGDKLSGEEKEIFYKMASFTHSLMMPNGLCPQVGDNDSGRVFQLSPENTRDHRSCMNLLSYLSGNGIWFSDMKDGYCCFYENEKCGQEPVYSTKGIFYKDFGIARYSDDDKYFCISASVPDRYGKNGHIHNDLLSFSLAVGDEEYIIDSGSGEYTAKPSVRNQFRSVKHHSTVSVDGNEQRNFTSNAYPFGWNSKAIANLAVSQTNDSYEIYGECGYTAQDGEKIKHMRNAYLYKTEIVIIDKVEGMNNECSLSLPLMPGINPEYTDKGVILRGKHSELLISGTWSFTFEKTLYAIQYKEITENITLVGKSESEHNTLKISIRFF